MGHSDGGVLLLVALGPVAAAADGRVDIDRERPQRADVGLLLWNFGERDPVEESGAVLPGDLVDILVGAGGFAQLVFEPFRSVGPD